MEEEGGDGGENGEIGWLVVKLKGEEEGRGCGGGVEGDLGGGCGI